MRTDARHAPSPQQSRTPCRTPGDVGTPCVAATLQTSPTSSDAECPGPIQFSNPHPHPCTTRQRRAVAPGAPAGPAAAGSAARRPRARPARPAAALARPARGAPRARPPGCPAARQQPPRRPRPPAPRPPPPRPPAMPGLELGGRAGYRQLGAVRRAGPLRIQSRASAAGHHPVLGPAAAPPRSLSDRHQRTTGHLADDHTGAMPLKSQPTLVLRM